jgi:signal transduction histidine kinase
LRLKLTLMYLVFALALIVLLGVGTYSLLVQYFQSGTDLALQHSMAGQFRKYGQPVPQELAAAEANWYAHTPDASPVSVKQSHDDDHKDDGDRDGDEDGEKPNHAESDEAYNAELAAIFAMPIASDGSTIVVPGIAQPPMSPDKSAVAAALANGSDIRTVQLGKDERVRLLTYRLTGAGNPAAVQHGRSLGDQDNTLTRLLMVLLALGGASAVLLGVGSWWVAGRSLRPAQQAWERQQSFVANASHELRTPLAIVRASTEVALRGLPARDTDRRELLNDVLQECDHMSALVEDLLLLSRLDAGKLQLEHTRISLPELLEDVQRQTNPLAEKQGVSVRIHEASGAVLGDPTRLRQVLLVLLDNALRHTPQGGSVTLAARPEGSMIRLDVSDTGTGIPAQDLPRIFERFYRGTNGTSQSEGGGSGLGLSIAKSLIEAQGGRIGASSAPSRGATISLSLKTA